MSPEELLNLLVQKPDLANAVAAIASAVMAAVACFISLISLYVSHATLKHQRKHNVLSVRPIAFLSLGDYEDSVYVKLQNNGTGPLIIKRLVVVGAQDPNAPLIDAMPQLLPKATWSGFVGSIEDRSITPGGELKLIDLSSTSPNGHFLLSRDQVREALGKLELVVEFTDIYGSKLPRYSRSLKWFHRLLSVPQT